MRTLLRYCSVCAAPVPSFSPVRLTCRTVCSVERRKQVKNGKYSFQPACIHCGTRFEPLKIDDIYCSVRCKQAVGKERAARKRATKGAEKARMRGAVVADAITPAAVFKRDSWICGICWMQVDRSLPKGHKASAVVHHIVPIRHGGLHMLSNVQCAHLSCSSRRGRQAQTQFQQAKRKDDSNALPRTPPVR